MKVMTAVFFRNVFCRNIVTLLAITVFNLCVSAQAANVAKDASAEPKAIVEKVTNELFGLVKAKKANQTSNEEYFKQVSDTLDSVVNFQFIAAGVMGRDAFNKASVQQRQQFQEVFKSGLVKSYAKGIAGYADSEVKIVGVLTDKKNPRRVTVQQEVTDKGTTHKLDYTMVQGKSMEWKLINVVLNGVNLGMSFQGQFKAAMRKHNNDLDQVIATWLTEA